MESENIITFLHINKTNKNKNKNDNVVHLK